MTRATPDWLLELCNTRGPGIDAIALFRGVELSVIVEAITDCEIGLGQGVARVCYTQGVTEAESAAGQVFSEERLLGVGAANCGQSVEELLRSVQRELATFLDGVPLADDCTLVAVRRPVRSGLR